MLANAILNEYIPFIMLLFSLYTISGGIRIEGDLPAHPLTNTAFIAVGGLLASFIGTTGAAMLLIRPLLETNRERKHVKHTVIFFIFVVCNCGGCLLPIGDPPLFLGYLRGVPFPVDVQPVDGVAVRQRRAAGRSTTCCDHFLCYPHENVARHRAGRDAGAGLAVLGRLAQRAAAVGRGALGRPARSQQAAAGHDLAPLAVPARDRPARAGRRCR